MESFAEACPWDTMIESGFPRADALDFLLPGLPHLCSGADKAQWQEQEVYKAKAAAANKEAMKWLELGLPKRTDKRDRIPQKWRAQGKKCHKEHGSAWLEIIGRL